MKKILIFSLLCTITASSLYSCPNPEVCKRVKEKNRNGTMILWLLTQTKQTKSKL